MVAFIKKNIRIFILKQVVTDSNSLITRFPSISLRVSSVSIGISQDCGLKWGSISGRQLPLGIYLEHMHDSRIKMIHT